MTQISAALDTHRHRLSSAIAVESRRLTRDLIAGGCDAAVANEVADALGQGHTGWLDGVLPAIDKALRKAADSDRRDIIETTRNARKGLTLEQAVQQARVQMAGHLATGREHFRRDLLAAGADEPEVTALLQDLEARQAEWLRAEFVPAIERELRAELQRG